MSEIQDQAYTEAMEEIRRLTEENQRLQFGIGRYVSLCARAADALEKRMPIARVGVEEMDADFDLIAELRKVE